MLVVEATDVEATDVEATKRFSEVLWYGGDPVEPVYGGDGVECGEALER